MKLFFRPLLALCAALFLAIPMPAQKQGTEMRLRTVVIDPGHGGKDPGCISRDKKVQEKDITLDVGKRLAQKISAAYPDVEVIMTRTKDVFVELENRAVIANKANANLFISIHVNAVEKGTAANGYSIHCLGQSSRKGNDLYSKNLDLVKRENSVIMMEDNYQTTYQGFDPSDPQSSIIFSLMQNAHLGNSLLFAEHVANAMGKSPVRNSRGISQDPFWVLWRTTMPSVLVELGFITNPEDLAVMRTEKGRESLAENLFRAFSSFKGVYDVSLPVEKPSPEATAPAETVKDTAAAPSPQELAPAGEEPLYGVQVLATTKYLQPEDPFFAGYKPVVVKSGKIYKYVVGVSSSLKEVKKNYQNIQTKFPDNFIVRIEEGKTTPVR